MATKSERADQLAVLAAIIKELHTDDIERAAKLLKAEQRSRNILNDLTNKLMEE